MNEAEFVDDIPFAGFSQTEIERTIPGGVKWSGNGEGQIRCPYHDDKNPSCSINIDKETFFCHACGEKGKLSALIERCGGSYPGAFSNEKTAYDYLDAGGILKYQVVRYYKNGHKGFFARCPNESGEWINNLKGVEPLPYHLPEVTKAIEDSRGILIVEGEKDCDRLKALGLTATCNHGGAGKWKAIHAKFLKGAHVFIIGDYDIPGQKHVEKVGQSLIEVAESIKVVDLGFEIVPEHGKDISNWLDSHDKAELKELLKTAKPWKPSQKDTRKPISSTTEKSGVFHRTDTGNAERLVAKYGAEIRYCDEWGRWLIWDERRWMKDNMRTIRRFAKNTIRQMYVEGSQIEEEKERKSQIRYALSCEAMTKIRNMIEAATSEDGIAVRVDDLDQNMMLLNVENGTIDLATGELQPHNQDDLITKLCPVKFDPDATCPRWTKFLERIMADDQDLILFLQKAIGHSLTGDVTEDVFFFLHGGGENGKTTFLNTIHALLGDYACRSQTETFLTSYNDSIPNDVASLAGARFVSAVEPPKGRRLNESRIKALTGGDPMQARFMRAEYFEFMPQLKLWIAANHKPKITDASRAMWRRVRTIPFTVQIPEKEQDKHLEERLVEELSGILMWALGGCLAWQNSGLGCPKAVKDATEEYRHDMDVLGDFLNDNEKLAKDPAAKIQSSVLHAMYLNYCEENKIKDPWGIKTFASEMKERGYEKKSMMDAKFWIGIGKK